MHAGACISHPCAINSFDTLHPPALDELCVDVSELLVSLVCYHGLAGTGVAEVDVTGICALALTLVCHHRTGFHPCFTLQSGTASMKAAHVLVFMASLMLSSDVMSRSSHVALYACCGLIV